MRAVVLLLLCAGLCYSQTAIRCSYASATSGYRLSWSTTGGNVKFNLTYPNFPQNSFTGVGFGKSMSSGLDIILVQVVNGQASVREMSSTGYKAPVATVSSTLSSPRATYTNGLLTAEFSRPIMLNSPGHKNLDGCVTWNFIDQPGQVQNGQINKHQATPVQQQVCDVMSVCSSNGSLGAAIGYFGGSETTNTGSSSSTMTPQRDAVYGFQTNTATTPRPGQTYSGTPFAYSTTSSYGQMGQQQRQMYDAQGQMPSTAAMGNTYGYAANTATTPRPQTYTGTTFSYQTTTPVYNYYETGSGGATPAPSFQQIYQDLGINYNNQPLRDQQYSNQRQMNMPNQYANQNQANYGQQPQTYAQNQYPNQNQFPSEYQQQNQYQNQYQNQNQNRFASDYQQQNQYQNQYGNQAMFNPPQSAYGMNGRQPMATSAQSPQYQTQPQYTYTNQGGVYYPRYRRGKRQTYTDNIYGYDYSSNAASSGSSIVENPNYRFLSGMLADDYARNYASQVMYDQSSSSSTGVNGVNGVNANQPVRSNDAQNTVNYQQIQQDYARNPNPTAGQTFTNNIYGYQYDSPSGSSNYMASTMSPSYTSSYTSSSTRAPSAASSSPSLTSSTSTSNRQYDYSTQNIYNNPWRNTYNTDSLPAQSAFSTRNLGTERMYDDATSVNGGLYYPFRTSTNGNAKIYTSSSVSATSSVSGNSANDANNQQIMRDFTTADCGRADPYWCAEYVQQFVDGMKQYNSMGQQAICDNMKMSLQESYNQCCQAVRKAGCQI